MKLFRCVHLHGAETLRQPIRGAIRDIRRPIPANPGIYPHAVARLPSQKLPNWESFELFNVGPRSCLVQMVTVKRDETVTVKPGVI